MNIPIQEVFTYPNKSHQLRVDDGQVELGVGASFAAALLDNNGDVTQSLGRMAMTDMQYQAWTGDDTAVARQIAINFGLVPVMPVAPSPIPVLP